MTGSATTTHPETADFGEDILDRVATNTGVDAEMRTDIPMPTAVQDDGVGGGTQAGWSTEDALSRRARLGTDETAGNQEVAQDDTTWDFPDYPISHGSQHSEYIASDDDFETDGELAIESDTMATSWSATQPKHPGKLDGAPPGSSQLRNESVDDLLSGLAQLRQAAIAKTAAS